MTSLTIPAFEELSFVFSVEETNSEFETYQIQVGEDEYDEKCTSWIAGYCTAKSDKLEVTFSWIATGGTDSYNDAHDFTIEIEPDSEFEVTGFQLVDEDGDEVEGWELGEAMREKFNGGEWEQLVRSELPEVEINCVDIDEDLDMETFTLDVDNAPSVRFTGELVASAASSDNQAMGSSYSGQTGRWTELALYKTKGGKYVCHQIGRTRHQGERDRFSGEVCETAEEVKEFFGHRWLAKELYAEAKIDDVVEVD